MKPHPEAHLKMFNRIEAWEWYEEGIQKIQLTGKGVLADHEMKEYQGKFLEADHFDIVAQQDCDVYLPEENDLVAMFQEDEPREERLLMSFRRRAISDDLMEVAWDCLLSAAAISDNRGMAAGPIDVRYVRSNAQDGNIVMLTNNRAKYRLPDGSLGSTTIANKARSGIAGYFDPSPRFPFTRASGWTRGNPEKMKALEPFLEAVDSVYQKLAPIHWARQRQFVESFDPHWRLADTVYTTLTINKNWQAAAHQDAGDYPRGFGTICAIEKRPYEGGWTGFPRYRVAADIKTGDFFGFNIHKWHGMTPMKALTPHPEGGEWDHHIDPYGEHGFDRLSIVFYARHGMSKARSPEVEEQAYLQWKENHYLPSKVKAKVLMEERQEQADLASSEMETLRGLLDG